MICFSSLWIWSWAKRNQNWRWDCFTCDNETKMLWLQNRMLKMQCPRCGEANVPPIMIVSVLSPIVTRTKGSWEVWVSSLSINNFFTYCLHLDLDGECRLVWWIWLLLGLVLLFILLSCLSCICLPCCCLYNCCASILDCLCSFLCCCCSRRRGYTVARTN